ncbi:hypothetical protein ELOC111193_01295 [Elizabethkingia occulta]
MTLQRVVRVYIYIKFMLIYDREPNKGDNRYRK